MQAPAVPADTSRHDQMVKLVGQMLALHPRLSAAKTPQEKISFERQIAATDTQIDRLISDLHLPAPRASRQAGGLTYAEIKIVEGVSA